MTDHEFVLAKQQYYRAELDRTRNPAKASRAAEQFGNALRIGEAQAALATSRATANSLKE